MAQITESRFIRIIDSIMLEDPNNPSAHNDISEDAFNLLRETAQELGFKEADYKLYRAEAVDGRFYLEPESK